MIVSIGSNHFALAVDTELIPNVVGPILWVSGLSGTGILSMFRQKLTEIILCSIKPQVKNLEFKLL